MPTVELLGHHRPDPVAPSQRRRRRLWPALLALLIVVLLVAGALVRATTEQTPKLTLHRIVAEVAYLPGKPFHPAWPAEGEAAVAVGGSAASG